MKYASLQEIRKWESEVHKSNEVAIKFKKEKVTRVMSCYIGQINFIVWGLEFEEIKEERPYLVDEQIFKFKPKIIREQKYQVLGFDQGDLNKIKERIKEFFKDSKTPNVFRINKETFHNKKIIEEIKEFVKSENNKIEFPPAKIRFVTCDLQTQANDKKKYTDARSEACYGLRKLFDEKKIEFINLPDLKNKIESQLGTISDDPQPDGRKRVLIAEDLSYEFVDALVFFIWDWGLVFGFISPRGEFIPGGNL